MRGCALTKRWMTATVCATALLLSSCGDGGKTSVQLVQGAGDAVIAKKTATLEVNFDAGGQKFAMAGQIDFANLKGFFTMDLPSVGKVELVYDGAQMFVHRDSEGWTRINLTGDLAATALQGFGADPRALLEQMSGAGGITEVSTEQIRGVETTHYRGDLDIVKALEAQGMPQAQIDEFMKQASDLGTVTSTFDVYIDGDGLAHRTVSHTKMASLTDVTITMDLLDFGKPVDVRVPADSEVVRTEKASSQHEMQQVLQSILAGG